MPTSNPVRARQHHPHKGFGEWGELLGDTVIASAVLDRLLHHSHVLNIPANRSEVKATGSERNARRGYSRRNNTSPRRWRRPATTTPTDQIAEQNPGGSIPDRRSWVTSPSTSSARSRPHGGVRPHLPRRHGGRRSRKARWKAIQQARLKGLSLRAIPRELGISRVTVRKYAYAEHPPAKKLSAQERANLMALRISATVAN